MNRITPEIGSVVYWYRRGRVARIFGKHHELARGIVSAIRTDPVDGSTWVSVTPDEPDLPGMGCSVPLENLVTGKL